MIVSTSGTREPLTQVQEDCIRRRILALPMGTRVVTGGCIGVDALIARVAYTAGFQVLTILPADHSRVDPDWTLYCTAYIQMPYGTTYGDRDQVVVDHGQNLLAFPRFPEWDFKTRSGDPRSQRSGTWKTIRIARNTGKPVEVFILNDIVPGWDLVTDTP